ncbi:MAG: acetyltransferase [Robiginitomaculum sp.]|nr:MAG: acetyltransferase [Robiginitomaculum sp.]
MRRDARPKWLYDAQNRFWEWWTNRFVVPYFDALGPHAKFIGPRHLHLFGRGVSAGRALHVIASADAPVRLTVWATPEKNGKIVLGDCVLLTGGTRILAAKNITIGDGCMLAHSVTVSDCDWHGIYDRTQIDDNAKPVTLADNVWLGDGAFVGKGVTIGQNSIVGARAVVTRDVPANVVVAGNPARVVKELEPDAEYRTRMDLLADPPALDRYMDKAYEDMLQNNTLLDWLRSRIAPGKKD